MNAGRYVVWSRKLIASKFVKQLQQAFDVLKPQILVTSFLSILNLIVFDDAGFIKEIFNIDQWLPYFTQIQNGVNSLTTITCAVLTLSMAYLVGSNRDNGYSIAGYISSIMTIIFMFPGNLLTGKVNQDLLWLSFGSINLRNLLIAAIIGYLVKLIYCKLTRPIKWQTWLQVTSLVGTLIIFFLLTRNEWAQVTLRTLNDLVDGMHNWSILMIPIVAAINCLLFILGINSLLPGVSIDFSETAIKNLNYVLAGHSAYTVPAPINMHALFDVYATNGGVGMLFPLIIAIWINDHRDGDRIKSTIIPTMFNLNTPLIANYPILFNFILLIPMIISSIISSLIPGILILLKWLPSSVYPTATAVPGFLEGFLSTNGNWVALLVGIINMIISIWIYLPFIKWSKRELQVTNYEN